MKKNVLALLVASAFPFVLANQAQAAGFALHEQGISGLGNAYAGTAAVAEDATTVWWNPAGMSRLPAGKHFAAGGAYIVPSTKFSNRASVPGTANTVLGNDGGDAGDAAFVPSAFFAMDINRTWNFGLGVSVPFGLSTDYDPNWIGRFQGIKSEVKTLNINPAVSYRFSDTASVGFGISYQHGEIDLLSGANLGGLANGALGTNIEGQSKINVDGDAWGFNVGGLFNVTPVTRVGVHYRSSIDYKLEGTASVSGPAGVLAILTAGDPRVAGGNVKLDLETPDSLAFSVAHKLDERWELLGDATWTHWSKIKRVPLVLTSGAASGQTLDTLVFDFEDTWRLAVGANYKLNNAWTLKMGAAFDQSPVPNAEARTVRLPDNDRYWLSLGARYQVSPSGALDLGYSYLKVKDADINNTPVTTPVLGIRGTVNGTYKAHIHIFGLQYRHMF